MLPVFLGERDDLVLPGGVLVEVLEIRRGQESLCGWSLGFRVKDSRVWVWQLLHRNVQRFRGGLVFKAHRLCVSLNSRLESNKEGKESLVTTMRKEAG